MSAPLYKQVLDLSLEIVNSSKNENEIKQEKAYQSLKSLCEVNEGSELDHPLQWEALGDFSHNADFALLAYQKGLSISKQLKLPEYTSSLMLAMAESYKEKGTTEKAKELAAKAQSLTKDSELLAAINEFLNEL